MKRLHSYRFELVPTGEQRRNMSRFAGVCRVVFNEALMLQKRRFEQGDKRLGYAELCKELTAWRGGAPLPSGRAAPWLADAPVHTQQQKLKDLERAYSNFFAGRARFPRYKRRGNRGGSASFRYPDPKQFELDQGNGRIKLPKLGWMRYRKSRAVDGELRNVTVSLSVGKCFVSIQTEREVAEPRSRSTPKPNAGSASISALARQAHWPRYRTACRSPPPTRIDARSSG